MKKKKYEYLKFVRWENNYCLFEKATAIDFIMSFFLIQIFTREKTILIRVPKQIMEYKIL